MPTVKQTNENIDVLPMTLYVTYDTNEYYKNSERELTARDWTNLRLSWSLSAVFSPIDFTKLLVEHGETLVNMFYKRGKCIIPAQVNIILPIVSCVNMEEDKQIIDKLVIDAAKNVDKIDHFFGSRNTGVVKRVDVVSASLSGNIISARANLVIGNVYSDDMPNFSVVARDVGTRVGKSFTVRYRNERSYFSDIWDNFPDTKILAYYQYYLQNRKFIDLKITKDSKGAVFVFKGKITDPETALQTAAASAIPMRDGKTRTHSLIRILAFLSRDKKLEFLQESHFAEDTRTTNDIHGFSAGFCVMLDMHDEFYNDNQFRNGIDNIIRDSKTIYDGFKELKNILKDRKPDEEIIPFIKRKIIEEVRARPLEYVNGGWFGKESSDIATAAKLILGTEISPDDDDYQ